MSERLQERAQAACEHPLGCEACMERVKRAVSMEYRYLDYTILCDEGRALLVERESLQKERDEWKREHADLSTDYLRLRLVKEESERGRESLRKERDELRDNLERVQRHLQHVVRSRECAGCADGAPRIDTDAGSLHDYSGTMVPCVAERERVSLAARLTQYETDLRELDNALAVVDFKAEKVGEGEWIGHYYLPCGPWHRVLGLRKDIMARVGALAVAGEEPGDLASARESD